MQSVYSASIIYRTISTVTYILTGRGKEYEYMW